MNFDQAHEQFIRIWIDGRENEGEGWNVVTGMGRSYSFEKYGGC